MNLFILLILFVIIIITITLISINNLLSKKQNRKNIIINWIKEIFDAFWGIG